MPIPSVMADLSTVAASNSPAGSESPISTDDFHRAIQAILRHTNAKGLDIASAASIDLGAATGEFVDVTGTTTITSLGTVAAGIVRRVRFTGILTLTHNSTSLQLPSSDNITTANGDFAEFVSLGSGNWKCTNYVRQSGASLVVTDGSITTTKLADDAVTKAKLNDDVRASNADYVTGTAIDVFISPSVARARNLVTGTTVTASGTSVDFTGIPSWAKRVTLEFSGISTNGTANYRVQLGDSGGIEITGYLSSFILAAGAFAAAANSTAGFDLSNGSAANVLNGKMEITLLDAATNTWAASGMFGFSNTGALTYSAGSKPLSATLDRIRLTTANGTDAFDAGIVNIIYE